MRDVDQNEFAFWHSDANFIPVEQKPVNGAETMAVKCIKLRVKKTKSIRTVGANNLHPYIRRKTIFKRFYKNVAPYSFTLNYWTEFFISSNQ